MESQMRLKAVASCLLVLWAWIAVSFAPLAVARSEGTLRVQLNWKHQFEFAAFYAAQSKGFYRDAGLDIEIVEGGPGIDAVREVEEGRADFGVGTSSVVRARGSTAGVASNLRQPRPRTQISTQECASDCRTA